MSRRARGLLIGAVLAAGAISIAVFQPVADLPPAPPRAVSTLTEFTPPAPVTAAWSSSAEKKAGQLRVTVLVKTAPVSGARLHLLRAGASVAESATDAQGEGTLGAEPGFATLTVDTPSAHWRQLVSVPVGGFPGHVVVELAALQRLTVRVNGAGDRPLAGAKVALRCLPEPSSEPVAEAATAANGKAAFDGLAPGRYFVGVTAEGYEVGSAVVDPPETAAISLRSLVGIEGGVRLPDGGAGAGARVTHADRTAIADARGRFQIASTGWGVVSARLEQMAGEASLGEGDGGVEIVLEPATALEGWVNDGETGGPLEGVEVHSAAGEARTAASGRFEVLCPGAGLPLGCTSPVDFSKPGYVTTTASPTPNEPFIVLLWHPGAVRGTVVSVDGEPVAAAQVTLQEPELTVLSDSEGRFAFEGASPPDARLTAEEGLRSASTGVALRPNQVVETTIVLPPPLREVPVEINVDGRPAHDAFTLTAERLTGKHRWVTTGQWTSFSSPRHRSRLTLPLAEGSYRIEARNEEITADTEARVDFAHLEPIRLFAKGTPLPRRNPLRVRVMTMSGHPVAGAFVTCGTAKALTDADGGGVCQLPEETALPIEVSTGAPPGPFASGVATDWNSELVLRLEGGATFRGRVVGEVPAHYGLLVSSREETTMFAFDAPDFVLEHRPLARAILCVVVGDERQGCAVFAADGGDAPLEIPVGPPGTLAFRPVDASGLPIEHARIYVDRSSSSATALGGRMSVQVRPGTHVLVINVLEGEARYETLFAIIPGATTDLGQVLVR